MAEDNLDLPSSPELTSKDSYNLRRNSTGKANLQKTKQKAIPIYLRASTGSCHDLCKHGKRLVTEEKPIRPLLKRISAKSTGNNSILSLDSPRGKRQSDVSVNATRQRVTKLASGTQSLSESKHSAKSRASLGKAKPIPLPVADAGPSKICGMKNQKGSSCSRPVEAFSSAGNSLKSQETNGIAKRTTSLKPRPVAGKPSAILSSKKENGIGTRKKIELCKADSVKVLKLKGSTTASLSSRASSDASRKLNMRNKARSSNAVVSLENQKQVKTREAGKSNSELKPEKNDCVHEKTLYVIKLETENAVLESDQNERCVLESPCSVESSQNLSFSIPLPEVSCSSHGTDDHRVKTRHLMIEAQDVPSESSEITDDMKWQEKSDLAITEAEAEESFSESSQSESNSFSSDETMAKNLCLNRGNVVGTGVEDNSSPHRLKFTRGRVLGEALTKKLEARRSFKKRGSDFDADEAKPGSEKVVLRHQDVQGKKDSIMFNNMIEETASKLVETRKSKVKALVGAFETVISLHEKKPSGGSAA